MLKDIRPDEEVTGKMANLIGIVALVSLLFCLALAGFVVFLGVRWIWLQV